MKIPLLSLLTLNLAISGIFAQQAVPVGKGSYAEYPPDSTKKHTDKVLNRTIYIDPSQESQPIPTNDWWTNLLIEQYSGRMWAYPLVIQAFEEGVKVFYPTEWSGNGGGMEPGDPVTISGEVESAKISDTVVLADFEDEKYPDGWKTNGKAFGNGPTEGAVKGQTPVNGYGGNRLVNSMCDRLDQGTGTLTGPAFTIEKPFLHFLIAGGNDPEKLYIELLINNKRIFSETGANSETLKWKTWDLTPYKGQQATIRIVDNSSGGWGHICIDQITASESANPPSKASANSFAPADARALRWGDWALTMRLKQDANRQMDATFGRGLPFCWFELKGMKPRISVPNGAAFTDAAGQEVKFPAATNKLVVSVGNKYFGIFAPTGATFNQSGDSLTVSVPNGEVKYLVVGALPSANQLTAFEKYAYAIPRNTVFSWDYDPAKGAVNTTWKIETDTLEGANHETLQGWIPHHYRTTANDLKFNDDSYPTVRGKLKLAPGNTFHISWAFNGIPPMLPAPKGNANDKPAFSAERLKDYIHNYAQEKSGKPADKRYGGDTYWGGKDLTQYGLYAVMAQESGANDDQKVLQGILHDALSDWFSYTPGEKEHFFARYDKQWKALIGFGTSYGSEEFTDNHFHYGYFTLSSALLGMLDPQFLQDYGGIARLVAKQYANWDRNDKNFPFLRTFDPWGGHSYAGGTSSGNGNNQESTSEAMQSWTGLFLLGVMMNDKDMTACGAMGWAIEESAVQEYWNNYYGWKLGADASTFSPNYNHSIVGILGDSGAAYGTFFEGNPMFIYGIQWLPLSTGLYYLGRDATFGQHQFDTMMEDQAGRKPGFTFSSLKADWGDVTLGFIQTFNPQEAAEKMEELWNANDEVAKNKNLGGITYYFINANRDLGAVAWEYHTDLPASLVYQRPGDNKLTVVAWNNDSKPVNCRVYKGDKLIGQVNVPGQKLSAPTIPLPQ
jgi:endoglucanase Acf2